MSSISRQVHFCEGEAGRETAVQIIKQKIRNQRGLLLSKSQNAKRADYAPLQKSIKDSGAYLEGVANSLEPSAGKIFLAEARASKAYWKTFGLLVNEPAWHRLPRVRGDIVNTFLDIGYHMLFQKIEVLTRDVGLTPEIGFLHSEGTSLPLIFDFAELWRQPIVDFCVLKFLRRHKLRIDENDDHITRVCAEIKQRIEQKTVRYKKECVRMEWVMRRELIGLRESMLKNIAWLPFKYPWGRSRYCK
jgi:CRISPR-associated endonuclease Cas1